MEIEQAEKIWKEYENGKAYQSLIGLEKLVPLCVDFYEGKQWGSAKKKTESFPRPVVNFIRMICDNKRANLLSSPLRIVYKSANPTPLTDKFNHFAEFWQKEAGMKYVDSEAIKNGIIKGTYIYHYYWDNEAVGMQGNVEGALRCQLIDVRNIVFSNPQEKDEQRQEWIIIASRSTVKSVKDKLPKHLQELVTGDNDTTEVEQDETEMITVLTKYYRKDGEVYFVKSIRNLMLTEEQSLAPNYEKAYEFVEKKMNEDKPNDIDTTNQTPDKTEKKDFKKRKAIYYPIVVGVYEEREGSIYGIGEVSGLINNQKLVNNILALQAYATEHNAFGKIVVKGDALGNQTIDNRPAQILYDYSKLNQQGIYRLPDPQMSDMPLREVEAIMSLSRSVTGSTEVLNGEVLGKNMSGQAIAQLQSQALLPTEEKRQRLQHTKMKQGKVMEMFFRSHYDEDREFTYTETEFNEALNKNEEVARSDVFNALDYSNEIFDVVVEVSAGTRSSVSGDIAMLDLALQTKAIDFITYLKLYPSDALSDKSKLIEELKNSQLNENNVLKQQLMQYEEQLKQYTEVVAKQDEVVHRAVECIKGYESLQKLVVMQNAEYSKKIGLANQQTKTLELANEKMFNESGDMFNRLWNLMSEEEKQKALAEMQGQQVNGAMMP